MNRWALGFSLFLAACAPCGAQAQTALPQSVLRSLPPLAGSLDLRSTPVFASVGRKTTAWSYLPPGYHDAANANRRYPVVYLMHGEPGSWPDCFVNGRVQVMADKLISAGKIEPMILVCVDGSGPRGPHDMTNFVDRPDGYKVEQMIARELVPWVDANFRTLADADHRALWGYSAGGYAALNIGFHYPNIFHVLTSHAGFYQPANDAKIMQMVLGAPSKLWDDNSPLLTVASLAPRSPLRVYLDDATVSKEYGDFQLMVQKLRERGIEVQADVFSKSHSWSLLRERCANSLTFASRCFAAAKVQNDFVAAPPRSLNDPVSGEPSALAPRLF